MSAVVKRMYSIQKKLNPYASFPYDDPRALDRVVRALNSEVHEALRELKPNWCWWQDSPINRGQLREEIVDCWFFALSLFELAEREGFDPVEHLFDKISFNEISSMHKELSPFRGNVQRIESMLHELDLYSKPAGEWGLLQLVRIFSQLMQISFLSGMNLFEMENNYYRKALINLERWGQQDTDLYQEILDRLPEPEPA